MAFRELFNVPVVVRATEIAPPDDVPPILPPNSFQVGTPPRDSPPVRESEVQREGAFITVQSLVTFPGAVAAVTVIVNVLGWAIPAWRGQPLLFVLVSALVGLAIYYINESDPLSIDKDRRQKIVGFIIAFFNTFVILSAAVGADAIVRTSESPSVPTVEVNHG